MILFFSRSIEDDIAFAKTVSSEVKKLMFKIMGFFMGCRNASVALIYI